MIAIGERVVLRQERDGEDVLELAAAHVERELRARDVRDDQVEEPRREVQPRRLREDRRRREVLHAGQHLGADGLLGLLQPVHRLADRRAAARPGPRCRPAAGRASRRCGCRARRARRPPRIETGTSARSSRPSVRTPRELQPVAQRAADDGEHDVVDRAAERVLDQLEVVELGAHDREAAVRADLDVQRRVGRGVQAGPDDLAEALGRLARAGERGARARAARRRARSRAATPARRSPSARPPRARPPLGSRRGLPRLVGVRRLGGHGREVEQHRREVDAGDAVDQRVVGLGDQREARRPRGPRPSTSPTAAWSGRAAGRRSARRAAAAAPRSPGAGSAVWRTWYSRLKVGSSTHSGRPVSSGGTLQLLAVARHEVQAHRGCGRGTPRTAAAGPRRSRRRRRACASRPLLGRNDASIAVSRSKCSCAIARSPASRPGSASTLAGRRAACGRTA